MLDVGWNVLVMGERAGQCRVIGMRLRVVPVKPLSGPCNGIAVRLDASSREVQVFPHVEYNIVGEFQAAAEFSNSRAKADHDEGRAFNGGVGFLECVNQALVVGQRSKH